MSDPDSISDLVARRISYTGSYPLAKLGLRLMTWHVGLTMLTCQLTGRWHGMLTSCLGHDDVILIRVWHVGRVVWHLGRVSPSERRRRMWRASVSVVSNLVGAWWRVRTFLTSDFDAVFTSGFISSSFTQWYGQNTILTTFIFEQKSNTTLNHQLYTNCWEFRLPHARTDGVLIVAQRRLSTLRHNI